MSSTKTLENIPYTYRNAPVPGGGFVTGFVFHPKKPDILYARTDIGGVYRYNFDTRKWKSLIDRVTVPGRWECYPLSIAVDNNNPDRLYIISGDWETSFLCRSDNRGENFDYFPLPGGVHGNAPGRGTGERLHIDPYNPDVIYLGTQHDGMFISYDRGENWQSVFVSAPGGNSESNIAFIWLDPRSGKKGVPCTTMVVSTSGQENSPGNNVRGGSLYVSFDAGKSFALLPGQPAPPSQGNYPGFVGQRASFDSGRLYITMASVLNSWKGFDGYACDMGGKQFGCVLEYTIPENSGDITVRRITPSTGAVKADENGIAPCGFGGICCDVNNSGRLICSTQAADGDSIFLSKDGGDSWREILHGLDTGIMNFTVPYMKPQYNGNANLIHWLSDVKINPFDSNQALFNTGTGIFMTENLCDAADGKPSIWSPSCDGVEETVHLNVYSPPTGNKKVIDIIGDLGGFAFSDLDKPCENSFADEAGNRYITCLNADYPDNNSNLVAVTARGNWKGKTTGGLILSEDQCDTWTRLPDPVGITDKIDKLIQDIRQPNTNSGWTAISSDSKRIVWCVGEGNLLPCQCVVYTDDRGNIWHKSKVLDLSGNEVSRGTLKVFSDRINPDIFYGFGNDSSFYVSIDKAAEFKQIQSPPGFPALELGGMDTVHPAEIRGQIGKSVVWISAGDGGLWKIDYSENPKKPIYRRVSAEGDSIFKQGMGKPLREGDCDTLYVNGIIGGVYGFWRSADEGKSFARINNDNQMYGNIMSIAGDPRTAGQFYIATGSRGLLYGMEKK